nr:retrovirus-related Pol polyprotein from transposon TNT 1-94 [Tanacetum cinerariifolium]
MNQDEVNELRAERLAKTHDPLALMDHFQNSYNFPATRNDQTSSSTHSQQSFPISNKYNPQPSLNQNFMQPQMTSLEDIIDPTKAMNAALILFAKAFQLTAPTNNNQRTSSNPRNRQIAQPGMNMSQDRQSQNVGGNGGNQFGQYSGGNRNGLLVVPRITNQNGTGNIVATRAEGIQLQAEEFDFIAAVGDLDEIEEVNANCILMANLQHASTFGTQLDKAPVYDTDGSAEKNMNLLLCTIRRKHLNLLKRVVKKMRFLKKEIKPDNYAKINHLSGVFVPQTTKSKEELFLSNVYNMVTISKTISIPNEDLSDDTTPSVARKFLNEVKNSLVTLQCVVKQKMTLEVHNWSCSAHKEVHKIISHEIAPIINQVDDRVQNFKIQFLQEAAKFVQDFKSLAKEADESLDKKKSLELEIKRLLKASVSHDIMSIVQNGFVWTSVTPQVDKPKLSAIPPYFKKLHASIPSHSVPQPREFNVVKHSNHHVTFTENVSSDTVNESSTGLVHTARTRRPQSKGNTRNAWVPSASKGSEVKKNVTVEDHRRILLLSKNQKTMSSEETNCPNDDKAYTSNPQEPEPIRKRFPNSTVFLGRFLGTVRFRNDHIAAILGYGDLKWGNITITRVYFVKGLGHNVFSLGQFCDADLEVAFRRTTCFIRDLDGVDLLKGNHSTNLYTINLYDMASASPICLMARATPTKLWLWHQRLSDLNFDNINDLAKNDLVSSLPKFKYTKEHLCPSCKQGKSNRASHTPKPISNSKQRLHLLHIDLCGLM